MERDEEIYPEREEEWLPVTLGTGDQDTTLILSERRIRLWALVLESRYLPYRIEYGVKGWSLLVPARCLDVSTYEVRLF